MRDPAGGAVDEVASLDPNRPEKEGDGGRGGDGVGDRNLVFIGIREDPSRAQIEVGRGDVELAGQTCEGIGLAEGFEQLGEEPLVVVQRKEAGWQALFDVMHELER